MDIKLIDFFGVTLKEDNFFTDDQKRAQITLAAKLGYIIHPDCCGKTMGNWLNSKNVNYNSTFYKNWNDVTSSNRRELWFHQILSYAINYGMGGNFDMNDHDYSLVPEIRKYKVILPISRKDLFEKCANLVYTGIALNQETCKCVTDFIVEMCRHYDAKINIDDVKNKEAMAMLCDGLNIRPNDKFNLLRYLIYTSTGSSMLIKDKMTIWKIQRHPINLDILTEENLKSLSSIFYRFKPLFLAFKYHNNTNKSIINKIRRMAKKYHAPMVTGFWETVVNTPWSIGELKFRLENDKPSNFKLITLIQTIRENRMLFSIEDGHKMYIIRNGSVWLKDTNYNTINANYEWWNILEEVLYKELVSRLSTKACKVKLNDNLNLVCPTSEKNFVGNIPFGSYFNTTKKNMIGIYWREEWGTNDFDLSYCDEYGRKIGWNSDYYNSDQNVIYSGDMTRANPEASEVIYFSGHCPNGIIKVNRYNGKVGSKYIFSVAQSEVSELPQNYMMDPNTIKFQTEVISKDKCEQAIGFVSDKKLYVCEFDLSNARVSNSCSAKEFIEIISRRCLSSLDLKTLLIDAGFDIKKTDSNEDPIDLDLSILNKDTLINLFS